MAYVVARILYGVHCAIHSLLVAWTWTWTWIWTWDRSGVEITVNTSIGWGYTVPMLMAE
jgi:hypothetical protein